MRHTRQPRQVRQQKSDPSHIKDLRPDPKNRRKHTPRNVGMIVDALHKVGAGRSIVIDEKNEVLAGNATLEAAAEAGITKVRVVDADGSTIVAVRRKGLSEKQKRDLALYDNRAAELAEWDVEQLKADLEAGEDLSAFFRDEEAAKLLTSTASEPPDGASQLGGIEYRVIVDCRDEAQQADLLRRFESEGLKCRPLIS